MTHAASPRVTVRSAADLDLAARSAIIALCESVFAEDLSGFFAALGESWHALVRIDVALIGHACWIARQFQVADGPILRAAYIKAVAVRPDRQRQGWGSLVIRQVAEAITGYDLGGLLTHSPAFYTRLGWEHGRGPTALRTATGVVPTPGERPLILRTPRTPPLALDAPLTAEWRQGEPW